MTPEATPPAVVVNATNRNSLWWDAFRRLRRNKVAIASFVVILGYIIIAVLAKLGILYPNVAVPNQALPYSGSSWEHPFGTDIFGRDILARAIHGSATALSIGLIASSLSLFIGTFLGAVAGYFGERRCKPKLSSTWQRGKPRLSPAGAARVDGAVGRTAWKPRTVRAQQSNR